MTEKEKMLNSQMYNPMGDKQLRNERCSVKIFAESTTIFRLKMKRLKKFL